MNIHRSKKWSKIVKILLKKCEPLTSAETKDLFLEKKSVCRLTNGLK